MAGSGEDDPVARCLRDWRERHYPHPAEPALDRGTADQPAAGLECAYYARAPGPGAAFPALDGCVIGVRLSGRASRVKRRLDGGPWRVATVRRGRVSMIPPRTGSTWRWEGAPGVALLHVPDRVFASVVRDLVDADPGQIRLLDRFAQPEPFIASLARGLVRLLRRDPRPMRLMLDELCLGLCVHLLHHHAVRRLPGPRGPVPFSLREGARVEDYIDVHLAGELCLAEISAACEIPAARLVRDFPAYAGLSLSDALLRRRVERALELLARPGADPALVVAAVGFRSAAELARAAARLAAKGTRCPR